MQNGRKLSGEFFERKGLKADRLTDCLGVFLFAC